MISIDDLLKQMANNELQKKYLYKFERCKKNILNCFKDLVDGKKFVFYYAGGNWGFSNNYMPWIKDSEKAWCIPYEGIIYISDWALAKGGVTLQKILIHELLHINFPDATEEKIIDETEKRFKYFEKTHFALLSF